MAERNEQRPLKRKYDFHQTSSAKKRALKEQHRIHGMSRIYIGNHRGAWNDVKREAGLKTDCQVTRMLLSCYTRFKHLLGKTSTPGPMKSQVATLSTPGMSTISSSQGSASETAGSTTETAMSGIDILARSRDISAAAVSKIPTTPPAVQTLVPAPTGIHPVSSDSDPYGLIQATRANISYQPQSDEETDSDSETDHPTEIPSLPSDTDEDDLDKTGTDQEVFQHESTAESKDDSDEDIILYTATSGIELVASPSDVIGQPCTIAYRSCLENLAAHAPRKELCNVPECKQPYTLNVTQHGTAMYMVWKCSAGHKLYSWCSQPRLKARGVPAGDFLLSSNIALSGNNFTKISLLMKFMNIGMFDGMFHWTVDKLYTGPAIDDHWDDLQQSIHATLKGKSLVLAGDARNDSPGHSAQYCTYTLMDHDTKSIVSLVIVDKRQVGLKSPNMEAKGMREALDGAQSSGLQVSEVVTDAHRQIASILKKEYTLLSHSWDVWHGAKNLGKKLHALSAKKSGRVIGPWVKDIQNHFWYCSQNCGGSVEVFRNMWRGLLHHVVNQHEWASGKCDHGHLGEEHGKDWLERGSKAHNDLRDVVMDRNLLNNARYYVNFRHTGVLESFHSHMLMYAAKRFTFRYPSYVARNKLAAIDYQAHKDRPQKATRGGVQRNKRVYHKRSGQWSVAPVKEAKSYSYIPKLQEDIVSRCLADKLPLRRSVELSAKDPRNIRKHLAPTSPPPTEELVARKRTRFAPQQDTQSSGSDTVIYFNESS